MVMGRAHCKAAAIAAAEKAIDKLLKRQRGNTSPDISHYLCTMGAHGAMASPLFGGRAGSLRPGGRERSLGFCWAAGSSEGLVSVGLG